jgi:ribose transport system substrate-binding protein
MKIVRFSSRTAVSAAAALLAVTALAACGSSDSSGEDPGSGGAGGPAAAADAEAILDELAEGFESAVPTEGPAPATGTSVWWISCGQSIPDCSIPAASAGEATAS